MESRKSAVPGSSTIFSSSNGAASRPSMGSCFRRTNALRETRAVNCVDEYERLMADEYDDSPWTEAELHTLAWEAGKPLGWEDMDEYDDISDGGINVGGRTTEA